MRYDTMISFWSDDGSHYDPDLGKNEPSKKLVTSILANVTDLSTDRSQELLGSYVANAVVARLVDSPPVSWSYCFVGANPMVYRLQTTRRVLKGNTLILGEGGDVGD